MKKLITITLLLVSANIYADMDIDQEHQKINMQLDTIGEHLNEMKEKINQLYDGLTPLINLIQQKNAQPNRSSSPLAMDDMKIVSKTTDSPLAVALPSTPILEAQLPTEEHHEKQPVGDMVAPTEEHTVETTLIDNNPATPDQLPSETPVVQDQMVQPDQAPVEQAPVDQTVVDQTASTAVLPDQTNQNSTTQVQLPIDQTPVDQTQLNQTLAPMVTTQPDQTVTVVPAAVTL